MTIQIATDWRAGEVVGGSSGQSQGGKLSFFYEEGTNLVSSIIFFDESNAALFASVVPIKIAWPNTTGGNPPATSTHFLGRETDGHVPLQVMNLKNKKFVTLKIREMLAITPAAGTTPTLDHFQGRISGVLSNGTWSMSFDSTGTVTRKSVP